MAYRKEEHLVAPVVQESDSSATPIKGTAVEIQAVYNARRKWTTIEQLADGTNTTHVRQDLTWTYNTTKIWTFLRLVYILNRKWKIISHF